jgi:hypothetical protein
MYIYICIGLILVVCMKVCYDTRNVPDAVNESPAISRVVFIVSVITIICFILIFDENLISDPWANELLTGDINIYSYIYIMRIYVYKCWNNDLYDWISLYLKELNCE